MCAIVKHEATDRCVPTWADHAFPGILLAMAAIALIVTVISIWNINRRHKRILLEIERKIPVSAPEGH